MREQHNINLVKQAYDDFRKGDIEALLGLCTDDIEWELAPLENVPFAGKRRGREQVAEFFRMLAETQDAQQFEPREYVSERDKVVVLGHYAWRVKSTGCEFESDWAHLFTVRNGKVASFREYADTRAAAAAYAVRPSPH